MSITNSDLTAFIDSNVDYAGIVGDQYERAEKVESFKNAKMADVVGAKLFRTAQVDANKIRTEAQKYGANKAASGAIWDAIAGVAGTGLQVGINKYRSSRQG